MRIRRQKEAPALTKPKDMVLNWNNPLGLNEIYVWFLLHTNKI